MAALVLAQGARNFLIREVSVVRELGDGDEGSDRFAELGADALQRDLGRTVFDAGELGHSLGMDANLGQNGV